MQITTVTPEMVTSSLTSALVLNTSLFTNDYRNRSLAELILIGIYMPLYLNTGPSISDDNNNLSTFKHTIYLIDIRIILY